MSPKNHLMAQINPYLVKDIIYYIENNLKYIGGYKGGEVIAVKYDGKEYWFEATYLTSFNNFMVIPEEKNLELLLICNI